MKGAEQRPNSTGAGGSGFLGVVVHSLLFIFSEGSCTSSDIHAVTVTCVGQSSTGFCL